MRTMAILGATGSIGRQALDLVRRYPEEFRVDALTAYASADALFALVREFKPRFAGLVVEPENLPEDVRFCEWAFGADCSERAARLGADDVLEAVVGIAGLPAALAALDGAKRLLLANKEALVTAGTLVMDKARALGKSVVPVDSEHSAIYQCLRAAEGNAPRRLILTASGGPFRTWDKEKVENATVTDVLRHPTWKMGAKVTVDCATLMNKGLEVIEAHHLYAMPLERIEATVHPQSVVHSMVEFEDGAVLAQLGEPDMRGPIGYAMGFPQRLPYGAKRLDFQHLMQLSFEAVDTERFPCLRYAYEAQKLAGSAPVTLNGANEYAVGAFLRGEISFGAIARTNARVLESIQTTPIRNAGDVYEADARARACAEGFVRQFERARK